MTNKTKTQKITFIATLAVFVLAIGTFAATLSSKNFFSNWRPKTNAVFSTKVQNVVSKEGITSWLIEDNTTPVVALYVLFKGGEGSDPDDKNGLSTMVSSLLTEGAGDLDAESFNDILEQKAIKLSFDSDLRSFSACFQAPQTEIETAFKMLSMALIKPHFDLEPINRNKNIIKTYLNKRMENPSYMAFWEWRKKAFPNHPYARQSPADINSIENITQKDLKDYIKTRFAKDNIFIGAAGAITADELSQFVDKYLKNLPEKSSFAVPEKAVIANFESPIVINMPVPQSFAVFGNTGIERKDKDFYAAYLMNHILGGGSFSSRLMEEVRSKQGLAYSVETNLITSEYMPLLNGNVATSNKDFAKSMATITNEWEKMQKDGVSEQELKDAKDFLLASFPLRFNSSLSIAAMLASMQFEDLGIDFLNLRNSYIEAVTRNDVNLIAKRILANKPLFVVAGNPILETEKGE
ncbi:MAG: M16 family metallopeptidase [Alphaproteobacteria bacterium]